MSYAIFNGSSLSGLEVRYPQLWCLSLSTRMQVRITYNCTPPDDERRSTLEWLVTRALDVGLGLSKLHSGMGDEKVTWTFTRTVVGDVVHVVIDRE